MLHQNKNCSFIDWQKICKKLTKWNSKFLLEGFFILKVGKIFWHIIYSSFHLSSYWNESTIKTKIFGGKSYVSNNKSRNQWWISLWKSYCFALLLLFCTKKMGFSINIVSCNKNDKCNICHLEAPKNFFRRNLLCYCGYKPHLLLQTFLTHHMFFFSFKFLLKWKYDKN